jgi:hypothetical protein
MTPFKTRDQQRAAFAKRRASPAKKRRVPVSSLQAGATLLKLGAGRVVLAEDQKTLGQRIYEIHDGKSHIGILGSELGSLAGWWGRERDRQGPAEGVLFRTLPDHEHAVTILKGHTKPAARTYAVRGHKEAITLRGSQFERMAKWWDSERRRRGTDQDGDHPPNPQLAAEIGRDDALEQINYVLQQGGSLEEGIAAHAQHRLQVNSFTEDHGDDAGFHRGAQKLYAEARRAAKQAAAGTLGKPWLLATDQGLHFSRGKTLGEARRALAAKLGIPVDELGWERRASEARVRKRGV